LWNEFPLLAIAEALEIYCIQIRLSTQEYLLFCYRASFIFCLGSVLKILFMLQRTRKQISFSCGKMSADLKVPEYDKQFPRRYLQQYFAKLCYCWLLVNELNMIVTNMAHGNTRW